MGPSYKHDIYMLVLELQELMTSDEHSSKVVTNQSGGYFVLVPPTNSSLKREPMKRMKPKRETAAAASSVKKMKSTQMMGIKQTVALNLHEIEVMATAKQHCTFSMMNTESIPVEN